MKYIRKITETVRPYIQKAFKWYIGIFKGRPWYIKTSCGCLVNRPA